MMTHRLPILVLLVCVLAMLAACGSKPTPEPTRPNITVSRDVPSVLAGTVGAQATIQGDELTLVSGFGLVVNLNGTGDSIIPEAIAAHMERELALMGVRAGSSVFGGTALDGKSPRDVLQDPNTAVVLVRAAIPPGAPRGATFDAEVRPLATTSTTSLEGGQLWTTQLQLGPATVIGQAQTRKIAEAGGPVFTNPFADPASPDGQAGRVLGGGVVTEPLELLVILDSDSHSRARSITAAINSRFPPGAGDGGPIARGLGGRGQGNRMAIALSVPNRFRENPDEFLELVTHLQVDPSFPEEYARRYAQAMIDQPYLADALGWALQAIGPKALPFVREMYDHSEPLPREAALRTGAHLGDPQVAPYLIEMAESGPPGLRARAARLLQRVDGGPQVDVALRRLAEEDALDVRIAAYESLAKRSEASQINRLLSQAGVQPGMEDYGLVYAQIERMAELEFSMRSMQGIQRIPVAYDPTTRRAKFVMDVVPYGSPLIYVAQQGAPRIALFGEDLRLKKPSLAEAWSGRLMLVSDSPDSETRLYYRPPSAASGEQYVVKDDLVELVQFLAREPTPEDPRPGLGLSYSEVVGALSAVQESDAVAAAFATQRDSLFAELLKARQAGASRERPESDDEPVPDWMDLDPVALDELRRERASGDGSERERPNLVVPLEPPQDESDDG